MLDILKYMNHPAHNIFTSIPDESYTSDTKIVMPHQEYYLTKTTIKRYKGPPQPSQIYIPGVTRVNPTTKMNHTFDVE